MYDYKMANYANGKIYKICCNLTGDTYYGSTVMDLNKRKSVHKHRAKGSPEMGYSSHDIINRGDWVLVFVEKFPCEAKDELLAREWYYMSNFPCVNKNRPKHTEESRKEAKANCDNKYREKMGEELLAKKREYHHANKEAIAERTKIYREENKEQIAERKRQSYIANIEREHERRKVYREANKEKIAEQNKASYQRKVATSKIKSHPIL